LRGEPYNAENKDQDFALIATSSFGAKEFRLWKLHMQTKVLYAYLKIETTITSGIQFLIETHDT